MKLLNAALSPMILLSCLSACSYEESPNNRLPNSQSENISQEAGRPLLQRFSTSSTNGKITSSLCVISSGAISVSHSVFNIKTSKNQVRSNQRFKDLSSEDLRRSIETVLRAPTIQDDQSRSLKEAVSILIYDHSKGSETLESQVLFSHTSAGLSKKDDEHTSSLIATVDQLCATAWLED